ncbi:MAG: hypothetical protein CM15mP58_09680 [Burkholderiaceae bacterium]|nr:MAG: hypothetical protein CM15mP58_09680 [Burkholderiaceae bacterium]
MPYGWGPGGYLLDKGALDFAGGTVVHINSGVAGLVAAYVLGKRIGYGKEPMPPTHYHDVDRAQFLWMVGLVQCGSNLEATSGATLPFATLISQPALQFSMDVG